MVEFEASLAQPLPALDPSKPYIVALTLTSDDMDSPVVYGTMEALFVASQVNGLDEWIYLDPPVAQGRWWGELYLGRQADVIEREDVPSEQPLRVMLLEDGRRVSSYSLVGVYARNSRSVIRNMLEDLLLQQRIN